MSKSGLLVYFVIILGIFVIGYVAGKDNATAKFNKELKGYNDALAEIRKTNAEALKKHNEYQQQNEIGLLELKAKYENNIYNLRAEYSDRLRKSEERGDMYRERVSSASLECRTLAEHTSRLDRTLTEGRELVRELRENTQQSQLAFDKVVQYLINDRNHLNGQ